MADILRYVRYLKYKLCPANKNKLLYNINKKKFNLISINKFTDILNFFKKNIFVCFIFI